MSAVPAMSDLARQSFEAAQFPAGATSAFVIVPTWGLDILNAASAAVTVAFLAASLSATGDVRFRQVPTQANVFFTTSQQPREARRAAFRALWADATPM